MCAQKKTHMFPIAFGDNTRFFALCFLTLTCLTAILMHDAVVKLMVLYEKHETEQRLAYIPTLYCTCGCIIFVRDAETVMVASHDGTHDGTQDETHDHVFRRFATTQKGIKTPEDLQTVRLEV